jgi:hypothetical protein
MPNRIDAEHFEHIIAEATGTTPDAIHHEVERVREEAKREKAREARATAAAIPAQKTAPKPPEFRRTEDVVFHLVGVLLWQQSVESPHILPSLLRAYLQDILGDERIQLLDDWSDEDKNKAAFVAEHAYGEDADGKQVREAAQTLLRELSLRTLRTMITDVRKDLKDAEQKGDSALQQSLLGIANDLQKKLRTRETASKDEFILHH